MNRVEEILMQIDELENELFENHNQFIKKREIIDGLKDNYITFIETNYYDLKREDLKTIAISAMLKLNGSQLMAMYNDLESRLVDYHEEMLRKEELEKRIEESQRLRKEQNISIKYNKI